MKTKGARNKKQSIYGFETMAVGEAKWIPLPECMEFTNIINQLQYLKKAHSPEKNFKTNSSRKPYGIWVTRTEDKIINGGNHAQHLSHSSQQSGHEAQA